VSQITVVGLNFYDLLRVIQPDSSTQARTFRIREYQRDYAWSMSGGYGEVEALLDDLKLHFQNASPGTQDRYVMGPIIVCPHQVPTHASDISLLQRTLDFEVVDGQQRLTTLLLLLAAIRLDAVRRGDSDHLPKLLGSALDGVEVVHHETDVTLALQNLLSSNPVLADENAEVIPSASRSAKNVAENFNGMLRWAKRLHAEDTYLHHLLAGGLLESLMFAVTIAHDRALALLSFERANARGRDLDSTDLVKNLVFMREDNASPDTWSDLDERWKSTRSSCERGTPKLNFADVIRWHHDASDKNAGTLSGASLYRHISRSASLPETGSQYVDALEASSKWLIAVHRNGRLPNESDPSIDGLLGLIRVRGRSHMKQHLPILLAARDWAAQDLSDLARSLEALMLVADVCVVRGQVIEQVLRRALTEIREDGRRTDSEPVPPSQVVAQIRRSASSLAAEHRFHDAVKALRYSKDSDSQTIRYILERVEAAIRSAAQGHDPNDVRQYAAYWNRVGGTSSAAVREDLDHVWPQRDRLNFPGEVGKAESTKYDQIGNLVLWYANAHRPSRDTPADVKLRDWYGQDSENIVRYLLSEHSQGQNSYSWARRCGLKVCATWDKESVDMLASFYATAICDILQLTVDVVPE
jgi:hypothetical protein